MAQRFTNETILVADFPIAVRDNPHFMCIAVVELATKTDFKCAHALELTDMGVTSHVSAQRLGFPDKFLAKRNAARLGGFEDCLHPASPMVVRKRPLWVGSQGRRGSS